MRRLDKEKQAWNVERERQVMQLSDQRKRLEEHFAEREATLVKERETESAALQETWTLKQNQWLAEHQVALQTSEATLTAKLHDSDVLLEERRQTLEKEYTLRQTDLQDNFSKQEKDLRQDLLQKEDALRQRYQTQLIHGEAELQKRFEAMAAQLGQDAESQKAILEDHRKRSRCPI